MLHSDSIVCIDVHVSNGNELQRHNMGSCKNPHGSRLSNMHICSFIPEANIATGTSISKVKMSGSGRLELVMLNLNDAKICVA